MGDVGAAGAGVCWDDFDFSKLVAGVDVLFSFLNSFGDDGDDDDDDKLLKLESQLRE